MKPVLCADSIGKRFWGREVLASATLRVRPGAVTALLGRNGAGKTTLLRVAAGRLRADRGFVRFGGRHVRWPLLHRLARRGLFYLPARGLLSGPHTVRSHLAMAARRFGREGRGEVSRRFELGAVLDAGPDELSGGERRRAEVAVAFLREPVCLLADEPFLGLAPRHVGLVARALRDLAERGTGVAVTGHETGALLDLAGHVTWLSSGTTRELGSSEEARRHPAFRRGYLGPSRS